MPTLRSRRHLSRTSLPHRRSGRVHAKVRVHRPRSPMQAHDLNATRREESRSSMSLLIRRLAQVRAEEHLSLYLSRISSRTIGRKAARFRYRMGRLSRSLRHGQRQLIKTACLNTIPGRVGPHSVKVSARLPGFRSRIVGLAQIPARAYLDSVPRRTCSHGSLRGKAQVG